MKLRSRGLAAAAALLAAVLLLPMALQGVGIFDEGFIASGAMMILRGDLPLRDFYVIYGPGQYYLSAGLMALFGESLLVTRVVHVLLLAGLAATVAAASYQLAYGRLRLSLLPASAFVLMTVNFLPNPGYPAVPAVLLLMLATWPLGHWRAGPKRGPSSHCLAHRCWLALSACSAGTSQCWASAHKSLPCRSSSARDTPR